MLRNNIEPKLNISRPAIDRVYTDKMNHIMIPFSDDYNSISIDRVPLRSKNSNSLWYFNKTLLDQPIFSSSTKKLLFQLKNLKNNHSSTSDMLKYIKSGIKKP